MEPYDLSKPNTNELNDIMKKYTIEKFDRYILVHNAGTEGDSSFTKDMSNLEELRTYVNQIIYRYNKKIIVLFHL